MSYELIQTAHHSSLNCYPVDPSGLPSIFLGINFSSSLISVVIKVLATRSPALRGEVWWTRADSNRLPPQCKWGVLPGELRAPNKVSGFNYLTLSKIQNLFISDNPIGSAYFVRDEPRLIAL